jgi:hypothetical protein
MTNQEKLAFANSLLDFYWRFGLGSLSKREIDLLVFHHITQSEEFRDKSNYELATLLKIPESRIKTFRLAAALKHESIDSQEVLRTIVTRIAKGLQHPTVENGKIEISLENPVEKRELENFLKVRGHFAEFTFNTEVLRIAPVRLFELLVEHLNVSETAFQELIRNHLNDQAQSDRILNDAPSWQHKFSQLRKEALSPSTLLTLITAVAGFAA